MKCSNAALAVPEASMRQDPTPMFAAPTDLPGKTQP